MNRLNKPAVTLCCGVLLGFAFALCTGAAGKETPKQDWSKLQYTAYASGLTGFFDASTGTVYLYDADMRNCVLVRRLTNLGDPMIRP